MMVTETVSNSQAELVMELNVNLVMSEEYQLGRTRNVVKYNKEGGRLSFKCPYTGAPLFGQEFSISERSFRRA